ncbi:MAG: hypothetical protein KF832_08485 [Caldilineaceae bacterium]|nr:hypothetical protein [Caldilineaceae bacterium]
MNQEKGFAAFLADVQHRANRAVATQQRTAAFILEISDAYAFIRLQDWRQPMQFLRQMAGAPPHQFGTVGFSPAIVDDDNPARHYTAFVFVGYWLPVPIAWLVLWAWEILGFIRYRGRWSKRDIVCGLIGIRHGRQVRRHGPLVLGALIARDLAA